MVDNLVAIAAACNVSFTWLATGEGNMSLIDSVPEPSVVSMGAGSPLLVAAHEKTIKVQEQLLALQNDEIARLRQENKQLKRL